MTSPSTVRSATGPMPRLGLGTWRLGEQPVRRTAEVAAVRAAIGMGYRLIDTAEMYGEGGSEEVVGEAIAQALAGGSVRREQLFIVSKVYPHNASRRGTAQACARSLERLGLDRIDLYLLHWRGSHPLAETIGAMTELVDGGRIGAWGVSNFDVADMDELFAVASGDRCATNQVYFSLGERGPGFALLPWMQARGMPLMAYSPIDQGALAQHPALQEIGARHAVTAAQVALAWVLAQPGVVAIPKAVQEAHLRQNLAAVDIELSRGDFAEIDRHFAPARRKSPLAMI